jgi:TfoX/Sxy family transcriptional regulator of competence genes
MPTDKQTAEQILEHLQKVIDASIRPMMGEYLVYIDGKVAGQINEGELFIKPTPFGASYASTFERRSPFPGAKPAIVVPEQSYTDIDWLRPFLLGTSEQLPTKKK